MKFFSIAAIFWVLHAGANGADPLFDEYEQILPRGGIAAITAPEYVTAARARIDDRSFVFGVVVDGRPLAYSLNLLNHHEVVNDQIGSVAFAAVW